MARRARGWPLVSGKYGLPAMPASENICSDRYKHTFRKRREMFPSNEPEEISVEHKALGYAEHFLWYEAESLFWYFLCWSMTAQPSDLPADIQPAIDQGFLVTLVLCLWEGLVSTSDGRDKNFIGCRYLEKGYLHPSYCPLYTLGRGATAFSG